MGAVPPGSEEESNNVCVVATFGDVRRVHVVEEGENLVGRWDPDAAAFPEIDLTELDPDAKVSRKHAAIDRSGNKLVLRDLGSRNGTFLRDGSQLSKGTPHELADGEHFLVAKVQLLVKFPK